jgi:hypothetical protein
MRRLLLILSRVFSRAGWWSATAVTLYLAGSLRYLPKPSRGLLSYALLMCGQGRWGRGIYVQMLRRDLDDSAELDFELAAMAQRLRRQRLAGLIYRRAARLAQGRVKTEVARTMISLSEGMVSGTLYAKIAHAVDMLALEPGEPIAMVTAGSRYLDLFALWLEQGRKHLKGRIVGIALDAEAARRMQDDLAGSVVDLSEYFVFDDEGKIHDRSRGALWILRVLLLREIVLRGHRVMSIDLDAVPVGDVEAMLQGFGQVDIVAQQDYSIPMDVARKLGFVLCCGFMVLYPTPATRAFLEEYAKRTMQELDDQFAINHTIGESGVEDRAERAGGFTFRSAGVTWLCPDRTLVSRDISYGSVVRHFQQQGETIEQLRERLGIESRPMGAARD